MNQFDLIVVGSGPGGYRAAVLGALRGLRVVIIERDAWGGCCLNRGCVPKKDWYRTACLLAARDRLALRGITGNLAGNLATAWQHQKRVAATVQVSYRDYLARLGVRMVSGSARMGGKGCVIVTSADGETEFAAAAVILAVGASPRLPTHVSLAPDRVITTDQLFDRQPPQGKRVAILGAGVVATELAFILDAFGLHITWFGRRAPLERSRFSSPARSALLDALRGRGLLPRVQATLPTPGPAPGGVVLDEVGEQVDWVLVATGRAPVTSDLDLGRAGITTTSDGFVHVDPCLETTCPGIYAVGDCAGGPMTANQAIADAAVVIDNLVQGEQGRQRDLNGTPEMIYSAIELARVGLNEDQAEAMELEPAIGHAAFSTSPAALAADETRGFVRLVADLDSAKLLGGEVVGEGAGELIHFLSLADERDALRQLARKNFNHPAFAEELQHAAETLAAKWGLGQRIFASHRPSAR